MASVNKVIILGNVGQDPEIRQGNFIVAALSIATTRKWRDKAGETQSETEWHRVSAFGRLAEIISQYVRKGDPIYIEGRLRTSVGSLKSSQNSSSFSARRTATRSLRKPSLLHSDALPSRHTTLTYPSDHLDHAVKKVSHSIFSNNSSPRHGAGGFLGHHGSSINLNSFLPLKEFKSLEVAQK